MAKSFLNIASYPAGLRNNNPGNLRRLGNTLWSGEIPYAQSATTAFSQFYEVRYGLRAMMKNIYNSVKGGNNTITKLITKYAPPTENNTQAYIAGVSQALSLSPLAVLLLTQETLVSLCKAMVVQEQGHAWAAYFTDQDYADALAILGITLKKKITR